MQQQLLPASKLVKTTILQKLIYSMVELDTITLFPHSSHSFFKELILDKTSIGNAVKYQYCMCYVHWQEMSVTQMCTADKICSATFIKVHQHFSLLTPATATPSLKKWNKQQAKTKAMQEFFARKKTSLIDSQWTIQAEINHSNTWSTH